MKKDNDEITALREKILDIESIMFQLKTINELFAPFANENCPQGTIIAELISEQLDELQKIIKF